MPRSEQVSDEELLKQAAGGNSESFAELFGRYRDRLWRLFLRLTQQRHEAEDLVQDTFVRVLRSYASFAGRGSFLTWVYAIALNVFRTRRRRAGRDRLVGLALDAPDAASGPEARAEQDDVAARVREAVSRLPEPQKSAIVLSRYEGLSYGQIAEIEGCSVDAVKQRVRRGMMRLAEVLKDLR